MRRDGRHDANINVARTWCSMRVCLVLMSVPRVAGVTCALSGWNVSLVGEIKIFRWMFRLITGRLSDPRWPNKYAFMAQTKIACLCHNARKRAKMTISFTQFDDRFACATLRV